MPVERGLPIIAGLCALCGAVASWNISGIAASANERRAAVVAESNLAQAERRMVACIENQPFTIGTAIYMPQTRVSDITTAEVPEARGRL